MFTMSQALYCCFGIKHQQDPRIVELQRILGAAKQPKRLHTLFSLGLELQVILNKELQYVNLSFAILKSEFPSKRQINK